MREREETESKFVFMPNDLKISKLLYQINPEFFCKTQGFLVSLDKIIKNENKVLMLNFRFHRRRLCL